MASGKEKQSKLWLTLYGREHYTVQQHEEEEEEEEQQQQVANKLKVFLFVVLLNVVVFFFISEELKQFPTKYVDKYKSSPSYSPKIILHHGDKLKRIVRKMQ
ncbi:MAG: hypothetical protein EOO06_20050 [Chitinophagaceae bacterium]|nr:MAG: hypothetical protein EOO06_20050 [Chitinophagaceae bacterium]